MTLTTGEKKPRRKKSLIAPRTGQGTTILTGGDGFRERERGLPGDAFYGHEPTPTPVKARRKKPLIAPRTAQNTTLLTDDDGIRERARGLPGDAFYGHESELTPVKARRDPSRSSPGPRSAADTFYDHPTSRAETPSDKSPSTGSAPAAPKEPPIVNMEADRIKSIISDTPARFEIEDDSTVDGSAPIYAIHSIGRNAVLENDRSIEREAKKQGVDPDLVRAIMYVENTQGYYDILFRPFGLDDSIRPMNVKESVWGVLLKPGETLRDPETNIRIGVWILKRLLDRVQDPTAKKIGAFWNYAGVEHTDNRNIRDYAARVARAKKEKPWLRKDDPNDDNRSNDDNRFFLGP